MTYLNVSELDHNIPINNDLWAVTLIKKKKGNHAMLAIERERSGKLFAILAHLTGGTCSDSKQTSEHGSCCFFHTKGRVKVKDLTGRPILCGKKTQTWQVTRDRVEVMIVRIRREEDSYKTDDQNLVPFSIFGSESSCTKPVKYYETENKELEELRKKNPILFKSIVRESQQEPWKDPIQATREGFWMMWPFAFPVPVLNLVVGAIHLQVNHKFFSIPLSERNRLVELAQTSVVEHRPIPNNCFTWARNHLGNIGVEIPKKTMDIFIAVTSRYTR